MTARWQPGEHFAVLAADCLGLLGGAMGADLAEEVWTVLRREADLGSALGVLTRRYDLRSMPGFAVVVIDHGVGHVAVRGDFTVDVEAAEPATVTGRGVFTWTERVVEQPRQVRIATSGEADGPQLPAADAVLLASALTWSPAPLQAPIAVQPTAVQQPPAVPQPIAVPQPSAAPQAPDVASGDAPLGPAVTEGPAARPQPAPSPPAPSVSVAPSADVDPGDRAVPVADVEPAAAEQLSYEADADFDPSQTRWEEDDDGVDEHGADAPPPDDQLVDGAGPPHSPVDAPPAPLREPSVRADGSRGGSAGGSGAAVASPEDYHVEVWGYTVAGLDESAGVAMPPAARVEPPDAAPTSAADEGWPADDHGWPADDHARPRDDQSRSGDPAQAEPAQSEPAQSEPAQDRWGEPSVRHAAGSPLVSAEQAAADRRSFERSFEAPIPGAATARPDPADPRFAAVGASEPPAGEHRGDEHRGDEHRGDEHRGDGHPGYEHPHHEHRHDEPAAHETPGAVPTSQPNEVGSQPHSGQPPAWALNPLMTGADEAGTPGRPDVQPDVGHPSAPDPSAPMIDAWQVGQFTPAAQNPPMSDPAPAPAPSDAGPVDDVDATVLKAARVNVAVPSPPPTATPQSGGELVLALACPAGHVSPTTATFCSRCGGELGSPAQWLPRPPLGMLRANTGQAVELTGVILVGRRPISQRVVGHQVPTLFVVAGASRQISRTQLEIRVEGWSILGRNVSNSNEVPLRRPGEPEVNLARSALLPLAIGDVLDLGDGIHLTLEGPR